MAGFLDWTTLLGADFTFRSVFGAGEAAETSEAAEAIAVGEAAEAAGGWIGAGRQPTRR